MIETTWKFKINETKFDHGINIGLVPSDSKQSNYFYTTNNSYVYQTDGDIYYDSGKVKTIGSCPVGSTIQLIYKQDKVHITEVIYKVRVIWGKKTLELVDPGVNLINVEIGGFISAMKAIFGLIILPYIYIIFTHSITKLVHDPKKGGKMKSSTRRHMLKKFHERVSFKGIYNLHDIVEQQEKEIE